MHRRIGPFHSITVFGGATMDRIAQTAARPVMGSSNPGTMRATPGGVGLNLAATLARLEQSVRLAAIVGKDRDGDSIIAAARKAGIETNGIRRSPASPTAAYHASLDDSGSLIVGIADMKIYDELDPAAVVAAAESAPKDDLWIVDANLLPETLDFLVGEAEATGRQVVALTVSPAKAVRLSPLLDRLNLLFTNRREAIALLGHDAAGKPPSASALAGEISRRLTPNVIVTNAAEPLAIGIDGEVRSLAPLRASVRSVNGAGDAFAAGTIHGLASGRPLHEAVLTGLAAAALTVEVDGTVSAQLTPAALAERIGSGVRSTET